MKSKIKNTILAVLLLTPFASCSDWLEVKPLDKMVLEDYWQKGEDVQSVILSCYKAMLSEDFMTRIILGGELRSDNVVEGGNAMSEDEKLMFNANLLPNNSLVTWGTFYQVINYCNTVISFAPQVVEVDPDYTEGTMRANQAEAIAIRALCYFYLVRIYKDVPYVTWPSTDDTQEFIVPQTPAAEILDKLVEDLKSAEIYAAKSWPGTDLSKGRITKNAVRALLADIYLWQGRFQDCVDASNRILAEVLTREEYSLLKEYTGSELLFISPVSQSASNISWSYTFSQIFGTYGNSLESIFELQFSAATNRNNAVEKLYGYPEKAAHLSASALDEFAADLFSTTDIRKKDSYTPQDGGYRRIFKYVGLQREDARAGTTTGDSYSWKTASTTPNWIIYRLADIMLMKAEALTELGNENNLTQALVLVNQTYRRSNPTMMESDTMTISKYPTQEAMRRLVLDERQRELLFEGKRWFDLLRKAIREGNPGQIISEFVTRKFTTNSGIVGSKLSVIDAWYWPIYRDELIVNPKLEQNPYYKTLLEEMGTK
jgi:hypothetical protein